ncbi:RNA-binding protein [Candidatus Collierbacteria bacterium]|nr:RNA-binding protein [Candidatus Collierbacteria bacterium]
MAMRLYVGNLPYTVNQAKLEEIFSPFGTIVSASVISDKFSGRSKGFGFVEFDNDDAAKEAIAKLDGTDMEGRPLRVNEAKPREEGTGGSSFGGGNRGGFGGGRGGFSSGGGRGGFSRGGSR